MLIKYLNNQSIK